MTKPWDVPPETRISVFFTMRELLWLPTWGRLATEADGLDERVWGELCNFAVKMDAVRSLAGGPIEVHCWYRPKAYNAIVPGSAEHSPHMSEGAWSACDFHVAGYAGSDGCATMRQKLTRYLDTLGLRMEDRDGPWIHLDNRPQLPGQPRFFKP